TCVYLTILIAESFLLSTCRCCVFSIFFFFTDPLTTEIYTLSLHDALPISGVSGGELSHPVAPPSGGNSPSTGRAAAPVAKKPVSRFTWRHRRPGRGRRRSCWARVPEAAASRSG